MICSMTKKEWANPDLLLTDRLAWLCVMRINKGFGLSFKDVRYGLCRNRTTVVLLFCLLLLFLPFAAYP